MTAASRGESGRKYPEQRQLQRAGMESRWRMVSIHRAPIKLVRMRRMDRPFRVQAKTKPDIRAMKNPPQKTPHPAKVYFSGTFSRYSCRPQQGILPPLTH